VDSRDEKQMPEKKKRVPAWLYPSTIMRMDALLQYDKCKSESEFMEKAVSFYCGYISANDNSAFISDALVSVIRGTLDDSENRISRLLFKLAVELSMTMHVVAAGKGIGDVPLARLRGKCVEDVRKSIGSVDLEKVDEYQSGM